MKPEVREAIRALRRLGIPDSVLDPIVRAASVRCGLCGILSGYAWDNKYACGEHHLEPGCLLRPDGELHGTPADAKRPLPSSASSSEDRLGGLDETGPRVGRL